MNNWQAVWSGKTVDSTGEGLPAALIRANGFDTGGGDYTEAQWCCMVDDLVRRLRIERHSRVLEVGCGAGALLQAIQAASGAQIQGYDYSASLIDGARRWLQGRFEISEAVINPFAGERFDVVLSHSVFQYFPDPGYAQRVLAIMAEALEPGGRIGVLDVNDARAQNSYHSARRSVSKDPDAYEARYKHHPHAFYEPAEMAQWLGDLGVGQLVCFPHAVPAYMNSRYRFNLMGVKTA